MCAPMCMRVSSTGLCGRSELCSVELSKGNGGRSRRGPTRGKTTGGESSN